MGQVTKALDLREHRSAFGLAKGLGGLRPQVTGENSSGCPVSRSRGRAGGLEHRHKENSRPRVWRRREANRGTAASRGFDLDRVCWRFQSRVSSMPVTHFLVRAGGSGRSLGYNFLGSRGIRLSSIYAVRAMGKELIAFNFLASTRNVSPDRPVARRNEGFTNRARFVRPSSRAQSETIPSAHSGTWQSCRCNGTITRLP
jgi:hypothetical protein